jgi:two-component system, chemotaxis family, sensor kinase Cph1
MKQQVRTNYDETFCGKLPLNQTNMIQPHGVLMLLSKDDFKIIQVSENVASLLNFPPSQAFDQPLANFITADSYAYFSSVAAAVSGKMPIKLFFNEVKECVAIVQETPDYFILEVELPEFLQRPSNSYSSALQTIRELMEKVNKASSIVEVGEIAAREIKLISGFDKVMIYAFDEQWNGDVIAEAMEEDMDSYLGLKFPASDIPKPARDMYFKNPYRIIPNSAYEAVRLYPLLNPVTNSFTNLIDADLRSVAAVHLEYLKNMKVAASMSTRIVDGGKLWGLIACHHKTAKYLSFEECSVFELLSGIISSRISSLHSSESFAIRELLNAQLNNIVDFVYKEQDPVGSLLNKKADIQKFLGSEGLAVCWNGTIETTGECPTKNELGILLYWLQGRTSNEVYAEPALPFVFEEAAQYADVASGVIALPVTAAKGNYILGFRPEVVKQVEWGGNPNDALTFEKNSTRYHPRNSFTLWQEVVRNTAQPWTTEEIESAEKLRKIIAELIPNN